MISAEYWYFRGAVIFLRGVLWTHAYIVVRDLGLTYWSLVLEFVWDWVDWWGVTQCRQDSIHADHATEVVAQSVLEILEEEEECSRYQTMNTSMSSRELHIYSTVNNIHKSIQSKSQMHVFFHMVRKYCLTRGIHFVRWVYFFCAYYVLVSYRVYKSALCLGQCEFFSVDVPHSGSLFRLFSASLHFLSLIRNVYYCKVITFDKSWHAYYCKQWNDSITRACIFTYIRESYGSS